jgi:AraC family transcriptional regulator of adaptative response/methylated-DNA-[protein]-cysteine methyltransferase
MVQSQPARSIKAATKHAESSGRLSGEAWRAEAVARRDRQADGKFVFAVRSTKIFCRPSCPARRPRPSQVLFFRTSAEACSAGYRACLRCRPADEQKISKKTEKEALAVASACQQINRSVENGEGGQLTAASLTASLTPDGFLRPRELRRAFRNLLGVTPRQYGMAAKIQRLKQQLKKGADVTTALYGAGFGASSRLYERTPQELGMTPATYRRGGEGMQINYMIVRSSLGRVLIGATEKGVAAVYLGNSREKLIGALRKEYPRAEIGQSAGRLARCAEKLLQHLDGPARKVDLPLDVQATAFQRRVWQELQRIPYGETRTYGQVAQAIGKPTATRAVARACATNPVSVIVPCHRVVRQDGNLAGYRWGVERKQALLEREASGQERLGRQQKVRLRLASMT